jgi:hypothetical protein
VTAAKIRKAFDPELVTMYVRGRRVPHTHVFLVPTFKDDPLDRLFNALEGFQEHFAPRAMSAFSRTSSNPHPEYGSIGLLVLRLVAMSLLGNGCPAGGFEAVRNRGGGKPSRCCLHLRSRNARSPWLAQWEDEKWIMDEGL